MIDTRFAVRRDFTELLLIEGRCFELPWTEDDLINFARRRNAILLVAEVDGRIAGFAAYLLNKTSIELLDLAVDPDYQRQGVARTLLARLVSKLSNERRSRILIDVSEESLAAQLFFRHIGAAAMGLKRGRFLVNDIDYDAIRFVLTARGFESAQRRREAVA